MAKEAKVTTVRLRNSNSGAVVSVAEERDPVQQTLRIGRLKTLERLGLAQQRQQGVWQLDGKLESKLRRLGDRADKFRTMQQVLKELGIDRAAAAMALFERSPRKVPRVRREPVG